MDGLTFIQEARKRLRFVPIVALTTQGDQQLRARGRAAGATAWMLKPTGGQELVNLVAKFLTPAATRG
jgi:two-component system chemotaxis response regulator CheY